VPPAVLVVPGAPQDLRQAQSELRAARGAAARNAAAQSFLIRRASAQSRGTRRGGAGGSGCSGQEPFDAASGNGIGRGAIPACRRTRYGHVAGSWRRAHNVGFDHDVGRAADHDKVLDVVRRTSEAAAARQRWHIRSPESGLPSAHRTAKSRAAESAYRPRGHANQSQHDEECQRKSVRRVHLRAEQIEHPPTPHCRRRGPRIPNG